ncbi:MAG TPA: type II toxin-antitoxin system VapC family toxin [Desulfobacterales bacterium]|nr:type II toxin-antitoxin system VapC family toxin [Desulfobacterales bacterium]
MRVALDTWLLYGLAEGRKDCLALLEREEEFVVSTLALFEISRKCICQGRPQSADRILTLCRQLAEIVPVGINIAVRAARYACGLNLSTADAIILATAVEAGCPYLVSGNAHFNIAEEQGIIKMRTPASLLKEWEESDSTNVP